MFKETNIFQVANCISKLSISESETFFWSVDQLILHTWQNAQALKTLTLFSSLTETCENQVGKQWIYDSANKIDIQLANYGLTFFPSRI